LFPTTDCSAKSRRFERKRLVLWFGIAVAFHAALLLGLWLMPALRIKWEPSPDAWVQVTAVPKAQPAPSAPAPKQGAPEKAHRARAPLQAKPVSDDSNPH
jgi:hypothetical protein